MKRFKNILFVLSGGRANRLALEQAVTLARQNEANLTLMIAAHAVPRGWEFESVVEHHLKEQAQRELAEVLSPEEGDPGVSSTPLVFTKGEPFIDVIRQVLSKGHDLVIKAADEAADRRPSSGFVTMDMHLLRKCPRPLWLFKPHKNPHDQLRLLAAVDPSRDNEANRELTRRILELATSLRERLLGATLDILYAWSYEYEDTLRHSAFLQVSEERLAQSMGEAQARQQTAFESALKPFQLDSKVISARFEKGKPVQVIPDVVRNHRIDLLIMGTVARTAIAGLLIGNTAETILSQVDCSVLAVKPEGFVTPVTPSPSHD